MVGTLAAGETVSYELPLFVGNTVADGTELTLAADFLQDGNGIFEPTDVVASTSQSATVYSAPLLELQVDEDRDPVAPGEVFTYRLTYGNRTAVDLANVELRLPLPAGVTLVSASDGGTQIGSDGAVADRAQRYSGGGGAAVRRCGAWLGGGRALGDD